MLRREEIGDKVTREGLLAEGSCPAVTGGFEGRGVRNSKALGQALIRAPLG